MLNGHTNGVLAHAFNPSIWEAQAEARRSEFEAWAWSLARATEKPCLENKVCPTYLAELLKVFFLITE